MLSRAPVLPKSGMGETTAVEERAVASLLPLAILAATTNDVQPPSLAVNDA